MKALWKAVVLTLICPGLGQFYLGESLKGSLLLLGNISAGLLLQYSFQPYLITVFLAVGLFLYALNDVLKISHELNIN